MNTKLLNEVQKRFTNVFNSDEKALLEDIRKHANSDELTTIDDLLMCDFDIDNNGYTYCFVEELIREIQSGRFECDRDFAGFYGAYLKFVATENKAVAS